MTDNFNVRDFLVSIFLRSKDATVSFRARTSMLASGYAIEHQAGW
jgi:hypothetical protein